MLKTSDVRCRVSRLAAAACLCAGLLGASGSGAGGQEYGSEGVLLDRWLVTPFESGAALESGAADPLAGEAGQPILPDRDAVAGPGYWTLVRAAPATGPAPGAWIDLEQDLVDRPAGGTGREIAGPGLAHAYLRSPTDRTLLLSIAHSSCRRITGWLNGQPIADLESDGVPPEGDGGDAADQAEVRLGVGWNTLLLLISDGDCPNRLGGWLRPSSLPLGKDEDPVGTSGVRVQASRPPGVRGSLPAGFLEVSALGLAEGLVWDAGAEDLTGSLSVPMTAWGRSAGAPPPLPVSTEARRPSAPPEVDLSGEWSLQVFAPQGLANATAELEMTEDGSLTGEVRGMRLGGDLEDGWVSGRDFRFTIDTGRRSVRLTYTGSVTPAGDSIRGTIAVGEAADFASSFRGTRADAPDAPEEGEPNETPAEPSAPDAGRGGRQPDAGRPGGGPPGGFPGQQNDPRDALIRQRLLPPPEIRSPAPEEAELRIEVGGDRRDTTVSSLQTARATDLTVAVSFDDLREASLSSTQVKLRLEWGRERRELARDLPPELLLTRLHAPILLGGWSEVEGVLDEEEPTSRVLVGTWRIPDALSGFTLELRTQEPSEYRLDGEPLAGERKVLCSPCREGDRLHPPGNGWTRWGVEGTGVTWS